MLCCGLIALLLAPMGFVLGRRGVVGGAGRPACCASTTTLLLAFIVGVLLLELALLCLAFWHPAGITPQLLFHRFCWAAGLNFRP